MKVAAYQAPYLPFGSMDAIDLIRRQISVCEVEGVEILCCPEAVIGGLAHESAGQAPSEVALGVDNGELPAVVAPLVDTSVTVIVGFTERDPSGRLYSSAAVLAGGQVAGIYRKVYPGYRTAIQPGEQLPIFSRGSTPFGIIICNDMWYLEPTRILAAAGAALILVPTNGGHLCEVTDSFRARGANLPIARAVENTTTVVVADVAGRRDDRVSVGFTAIIDPDGIVLARADPLREALLVAEVESARRHHRDPRGWDGHTNPAVAQAFLGLWSSDWTKKT